MRRFDRVRGRERWQRHPHTLLAHRPCPPVAHSITLVALFSSAWTSEANDSSGRDATGFAGFIENRVSVAPRLTLLTAPLLMSIALCVRIVSPQTERKYPRRR
jgi:hypothetical protein